MRFPLKLSTFHLVASSVACVSLNTQAVAQTTPAGTSPPAAYSVGAAFDISRNRLVVFGGFSRGQYFGDTWEHDSTGWTRSPNTSPTARNNPMLAYDAARRQLILFGGDTRATGPLGDTWVRDGAVWRAVTTSGPPARTAHAMVYDARRQRIVLFGGSAGSGVLGDTWEWDGTRWTQVATNGPPARALHTLAYDDARGRVVLYGGTSALAPDASTFDDTWEWDGKRWSRISTAGPGARDHAAMAYDATRHQIILHGGSGASATSGGETWSYDGKSWSRLAVTGPRRLYPRIVFDPGAGALLLYGGFDTEPSNELWTLRATQWERVAH